MNIIIPMTGYGSRFVNAGYQELKPLIKVEGRSIIDWIVNGMYAGTEKIFFVCRDEHLKQDPQMVSTLLQICPSAQILSIENWEKKGPVNDLMRVKDAIPDEEPCIVNYCDVYVDWDYPAFKKELEVRQCHGAIACYRGFHPHLLKKNNVFASCLTDREDNLIQIREKYSFEKDKLNGKHSAGVYYYKTGTLLKKYCQKLLNSKQKINGEDYSSLTYNFMVQDGLKVWVPVNCKKYCQWGTPEDLEESVFWLDAVRRFRT